MRAIAERWRLDSYWAQHVLLLRGYIMNKLIMVGFALLTVAACSEVDQEATVASAPVELQTASWDAVGTTFYTEMIPCAPGADFGRESVDAMITEWRGIGVSPDLLGSWGYGPASDQNSNANAWWELQWASKEAADAGWSEWETNEAAAAWATKNENVMVCDGAGRVSFDFSFSRAVNSFGESPESGEFFSAFMPCKINEGKTQDDVDANIVSYNKWLDALEGPSSFYAFGIYSVRENSTMTEDVDFFWGNFHESMDSMKAGNEGWNSSGGETKAMMEAGATCGAPNVYNSKTFYDPTNADFS